MRLYPDTSVPGALFDIEDPPRIDKKERLLKLIEEGNYEGYISNVVIEELEKAPCDNRKNLMERMKSIPLAVLGENLESRELTAFYLEAGIVPDKYRDDLRYVAVAVVHRMDALISWNFKHLETFISVD